MRPDLLTYLGVAALGGYAMVEGLRLGGSSGMFPAALGIVLATAAVIGLVRAWRMSLPKPAGPDAGTDTGGTDDTHPSLHPGRVQVVGLLLLAGYVMAAEHVGLLTGALLFMPLLAWIGGHERRLQRLLPVTVLFVGAMYVVFSLLLRLPLPQDVIFG
ncbi:tripartite tricarboxylate transporter TctB family protein [Rhodospira trueperi]|uniref:Tripartite tricarboxylate transporter TctB family protein n=1 Tax=Rhodospira trueperi TaxID=69960 RepID=A0A1G7DEC2_9PROT|nr:tripartite tricarboxylate transporter TctB family protein [Rhodospira trueperi]SDE49155.1 Tripartite tricarboxylate transporter TctB family protein [Rhodospira trueperi]